MTSIPTRTLGRTGLEVTKLGFGALELRGALHGREVSQEHAETMLNTVLDSGINFIDTSIDYGQSEEFIGKYISHRRSEYYLATKCGCVVGEIPDREKAPFTHTFTRENIIAGVEQSLARMKTDYIDLLQFHAHPSKETLEENGSVETVLDLQQQGKVRFIGMSSTLPNLLDHIAMGVFDTFQIPYSALQREHEEVITQAAQAGAGIIIRGGAAKGVLPREKREDDRWAIWQRAQLDDLLDGMDPTEFVLRFTFTHPELHTNIVGTLSLEHLRDNLNVLGKGPLPSDQYEEAKLRLAKAGTAPASL